MSNLCICTTQCLPDAQPQKLLKIFVKRGQRAKTLDSILAAVVNVSIHSGNKKKKRYTSLQKNDQDENVLDETTSTMCTTSTTCFTL